MLAVQFCVAMPVEICEAIGLVVNCKILDPPSPCQYVRAL